jgi:hypothetical protein
VTAGRQQQRVAVGRRFRDGVGADVAARAGAIFDDDGLAEIEKWAKVVKDAGIEPQ